MRSALVLLFALSSTAAFAQTRTVTAVAPETAMAAGIHGAGAAAAASGVALPRVITHQHIRAMVAADFAHPLMTTNDSSLSYTFDNASTATAPRLVRASGLDLKNADLNAAGKQTEVAVRMIVDRAGVPQQVAIAQSAGPAVDQAALATVQSYRFAPAVSNNLPIEAPVTVVVTIDKE